MCAGVLRCQKRISDPMHLELQEVCEMSNVDAGKWTWVLGKSNTHSQQLSYLSSTEEEWNISIFFIIFMFKPFHNGWENTYLIRLFEVFSLRKIFQQLFCCHDSMPSWYLVSEDTLRKCPITPKLFKLSVSVFCLLHPQPINLSYSPLSHINSNSTKFSPSSSLGNCA